MKDKHELLLNSLAAFASGIDITVETLSASSPLYLILLMFLAGFRQISQTLIHMQIIYQK